MTALDFPNSPAIRDLFGTSYIWDGEKWVIINTKGIGSAAAMAFLARASGLTVARQNLYVALIEGLEADGLWSKLDVLQIYATANQTTALLNLVSSSYTSTVSGTIPFVVDSCFDNSGGGGFLLTGFVPSTAPSPKFTRDSAHLSIWNLRDVSTSFHYMGAFPPYSTISGRISNLYATALNDGTGISVASSDGRGFFTGSRTSSTALALYKSGASLTTGSIASTGLTNQQFPVAGQNNSGSTFGSQIQPAAITIGSGLTAAESLALYVRLRTYMAAVGVSTETTAFLARTSGLDAAHTAAYTTLINGLVADGVWPKLDVLRIYATQNQATALLNLVSSSYNATLNGSPTFTADVGFTGVEGSTTAYLDSGFNPSTATSPKYVQNSAHVGLWQVTNFLGNSPWGHSNSGATINAYVLKNSGDSILYPRLNGGSSGGNIQTTSPTVDGCDIATRVLSNQVGNYKNGIATNSTGAYNSTGIASLNFYELGINNNGVALGSGSQLQAIHWGSGLTATDAFNLYARVRTFFIAIAGMSPWQTAYTQNFTSNSTGWSGRTLRNVIIATQTYSGTSVRVTLSPSSGASFSIDAAYIGHAASSGDAYDFDGTQVPLLFSGSGSVSTTAGVNVVSDAVAYPVDKTKNLIISVHFSTTSAVRFINNASNYYKDAVNEAGTTNVTGYTTAGTHLVSKVEVM